MYCMLTIKCLFKWAFIHDNFMSKKVYGHQQYWQVNAFRTCLDVQHVYPPAKLLRLLLVWHFIHPCISICFSDSVLSTTSECRGWLLWIWFHHCRSHNLALLSGLPLRTASSSFLKICFMVSVNRWSSTAHKV